MIISVIIVQNIPDGFPDRHILFSSRHVESRDEALYPTFPGIMDAFDSVDQSDRFKVVAQQVAILTHALEAAIAVLKDVTSW